jgi:hypothetical protein
MNYYFNPLKCSGCAQEFPFPFLERSYTDLPGSAMTADTRQHFCDMILLPAWCLQCEGASYVERVPTEREFNAAAGLRRMPEREGQKAIEDNLLEIEVDDFRWLYEHLAHRKAPPKCVVCGSTQFIPIDEMLGDTGITHEACWDSPIHSCGFPIGSGGNRYSRELNGYWFYDLTGEFKWGELENSPLRRYRLTAILHAEHDDPHYALLNSAIRLLLDRATEQAVATLMPLVTAEVPAAIGILGAVHYLGAGVSHSGTDAAALLSKAKALGNACAAHNLALLFSTGAPGVAQDIPLARQLFDDALAMGGQYAADDFYALEDFAAGMRTYYRPE